MDKLYNTAISQLSEAKHAYFSGTNNQQGMATYMANVVRQFQDVIKTVEKMEDLAHKSEVAWRSNLGFAGGKKTRKNRKHRK